MSGLSCTLCVGVTEDALPRLPPAFEAERRLWPCLTPLLERHTWWDITSTIGPPAYQSPKDVDGRRDGRLAGVHAELRDWLWEVHLGSDDQVYLFVHSGEDSGSPPVTRQLLLAQAEGRPLVIPSGELRVLVTS